MLQSYEPFIDPSGLLWEGNQHLRRLPIKSVWVVGMLLVSLTGCAPSGLTAQDQQRPTVHASPPETPQPQPAKQTLGTSASKDASSSGEATLLAASASPKSRPLPPTEGVFDYQLGGVSDQLPGEAPITVVVRDATAQPLAGAYNICYVNGFQTQDDQAELWANHEELILHHANGKRVIDPDWPGEYILDPSTPAQREGIIAILGPVIQGCKTAGFDAVEIDNFDTFTRFDQITQDAAFALAAQYVTIAHEAGLAIAQKNAAEFTHDAHTQLGFDFAIAEGCAVWGECDAYRQVYGPHVLQIEYADELNAHTKAFEQVCSQPDRSPLTVLRDSELRPAHEPNHRYARC